MPRSEEELEAGSDRCRFRGGEKDLEHGSAPRFDGVGDDTGIDDEEAC
jgi:hypothetical protein